MKFIFPQNYDFKNKILGVIDYTTAFVNIVWIILIFLLSNLFFNSLSNRICMTILFCFPVILFSFSGFHGENIFYVIFYLSRFIFKQKLYFYSKKTRK